MEKSLDSSTNVSSRQMSGSKVKISRVLSNQNTSTSDLACKICLNILPLRDGEVCNNCGEQFCSECVEEKVRKAGNNKCVLCKADYRAGTIPRIVRNLLKELKIICVNCNQSYNYDDISRHEEECLYRPKTCSGCNSQFTVKDFEDHVSVCEEIKIRCQKCTYEACRRDFNHECNSIIFLTCKLNELNNKLDNFEDVIFVDPEEKSKKLEEDLDFKIKISMSKLEDDITSNIRDLKHFEKKFTLLDEKLKNIENSLLDAQEESDLKDKQFKKECEDKITTIKNEVNIKIGDFNNKLNNLENYIQNSYSCEEKIKTFAQKMNDYENKITEITNNLQSDEKLLLLEQKFKKQYEEKLNLSEQTLMRNYQEKVSNLKEEINLMLENSMSQLEDKLRSHYEENLKKKSEEFSQTFLNNIKNTEEGILESSSNKIKEINESLIKFVEDNSTKIENLVKSNYDDKIDLLMNKFYYNKEKLMNLQEDSVIIGESNITTFLSLEEYDNNMILCGFDNGAINSYNVNSGELVDFYKEHSSDILDLKYLGNYRRGYFVSSCKNLMIKIWDLAEKKSMKTFVCKSSSFRLENLYNFSSDGFVSGDEAGNILLWNIERGESKLVSSDVKHKSCVFSLTHFRTKAPYNLLASGGNGTDHTIYLWDLNTFKCLMSYSEHTNHIYAISYYKEDFFLSSSEDKTIKVWSIHEKKSVDTLNIHSSDVFSLLIIPEEDILISSSFDKTLKITDINKKKVLKSYKINECMRIVVLLKGNKYKVIGSHYWSKNIMVLSIKYN